MATYCPDVRTEDAMRDVRAARALRRAMAKTPDEQRAAQLRVRRWERLRGVSDADGQVDLAMVAGADDA